MAINCPNKNLPEWKKLVDSLGGDEDKAMLAYHRNNDKFPTLDKGLSLLNRIKGIFKSMTYSSPEPIQIKPKLTSRTLPDGSVVHDYATPEDRALGSYNRKSYRNELKIQKELRMNRGKLYDYLTSRFWDVSEGMKKYFRKWTATGVMDSWTAVNRAGGLAKEKLLEYQDQIRKTLGSNYRKIYPLLGRYMEAERAIEIDTNRIKAGQEPIKSPMTIEEYKAGLKGIQNALSPEEFAQLQEASKTWQQYRIASMQKLLDNGMINQAQYDKLVTENPKYFTRDFLQNIIGEGGKGKEVKGATTPIKALDEGSVKPLIQNPDFLLSNLISGTERAIAHNNFVKSLGETIASNKGLAKDLKANYVPSEQTETVGGKTYMRYSEQVLDAQGKPTGQTIEKQFLMDSDIASFIKTSDPQMTPSWANWVQWLSWTKPVKFLAVGGNPAFALTNIPVDIFYRYMRSGQYSWFMPIALKDMGVSIARVSKDVMNMTGIAKRYFEWAGDHGGLVASSILGTNPAEAGFTRRGIALAQFEKIMGYLGNKSELLGRVSHADYLIRVKHYTEERAFAEAAELINYKNGGAFTKALDNAFPFLNASVEATKGLMASLKDNPKLFTAKVAQLMMLGYGTAVVANLYRKNAWESVSDREKTNNLIFPLPYSYKDAQGRDRHVYIRIKLDQQGRIFKQIGEEMANAQFGDATGSEKRIAMARSFLSPVNLNTALPPSIASLVGYAQNRDFWKERDIWNGAKVDPKAEYTADTPESFVKMGQATGMSPERLKYMTERLIPVNPFTALIGMAHDMFVGKDNEVNKTMQEKLLALPMAERLIRSTSPYELKETEQKKAKKFGINVGDTTAVRTQQKIQDAEVELNTARQKMNVEVDKIVAKVRNGSMPKDEFYTWLTQQGLKRPERKRLIKRFREKV